MQGPVGSQYTHQAFPNPTLFGNKSLTAAAPFDFSMVSKNDYHTDKIQNIHRYTWINKPTCKEVKFKQLGKFQQVGTATLPFDAPNTASISFQDWDYDVIWIRIHGKAQPKSVPDSCCKPTNILIHIVQNVECIFGEQNKLHSLMTGGNRQNLYIQTLSENKGQPKTRKPKHEIN